MIHESKIKSILDGYDYKKITIATIGSHTTLQILKGARDDGFKNMVISKKGTEDAYRLFGLADEVLTVEKYTQVLERAGLKLPREFKDGEIYNTGVCDRDPVLSTLFLVYV